LISSLGLGMALELEVPTDKDSPLLWKSGEVCRIPIFLRQSFLDVEADDLPDFRAGSILVFKYALVPFLP